MSLNFDPFHPKKTAWDYVASVLHLPHRETKTEQIWHGLLRVLLSLSLIAVGFLLGILYSLNAFAA